MITEAYFISHCDDYSCDLGSFNYTCPNCNKTINDYEIWWDYDDIYNGKEVEFKCECCKSDLIVFYNKEDYCYYTKINEKTNIH